MPTPLGDNLTDDPGLPRTQRDRMTDMTLIVAEMRAGELLATLQAAVDGAPHWRSEAKQLLHSIADLELPEPVPEQLRDTEPSGAATTNTACCWPSSESTSMW
jgi:hypothetical protein